MKPIEDIFETICPISRDRIEIPLRTPCCDKLFNAKHILDWFKRHGTEISTIDDNKDYESRCICCNTIIKSSDFRLDADYLEQIKNYYEKFTPQGFKEAMSKHAIEFLAHTDSCIKKIPLSIAISIAIPQLAASILDIYNNQYSVQWISYLRDNDILSNINSVSELELEYITFLSTTDAPSSYYTIKLFATFLPIALSMYYLLNYSTNEVRSVQQSILDFPNDRQVFNTIDALVFGYKFTSNQAKKAADTIRSVNFPSAEGFNRACYDIYIKNRHALETYVYGPNDTREQRQNNRMS